MTKSMFALLFCLAVPLTSYALGEPLEQYGLDSQCNTHKQIGNLAFKFNTPTLTIENDVVTLKVVNAFLICIKSPNQENGVEFTLDEQHASSLMVDYGRGFSSETYMTRFELNPIFATAIVKFPLKDILSKKELEAFHNGYAIPKTLRLLLRVDSYGYYALGRYRLDTLLASDGSTGWLLK